MRDEEGLVEGHVGVEERKVGIEGQRGGRFSRMKDRRKAGIEEERKEEERKEERGSGGYLFTPSVFTCPPSYRNKSRRI